MAVRKLQDHEEEVVVAAPESPMESSGLADVALPFVAGIAIAVVSAVYFSSLNLF